MGDRVLVHRGFDGEYSDWLRGGADYPGTTRKLTAHAAAVELDAEIELEAPSGAKWQDFGRGSATALREVDVARSLAHLDARLGGTTWSDTVRLQVGLSQDEPDLYAVLEGGGIGYWVESHAGIALLDHDAP